MLEGLREAPCHVVGNQGLIFKGSPPPNDSEGFPKEPEYDASVALISTRARCPTYLETFKMLKTFIVHVLVYVLH